MILVVVIGLLVVYQLKVLMDGHDQLLKPTWNISNVQGLDMGDSLVFEHHQQHDMIEEVNPGHSWVTFNHLSLNNFALSAFWDDRWSNISEPNINIMIVLETVTNITTQMYCLVQCSSDHHEKYKIDNELLIKIHQPGFIAHVKLENHVYGRYNVPCLNLNMSSCSHPDRVSIVTSSDLGLKLNHTNSVAVEYPSKRLEHIFGVCVPVSFGDLDPVRVTGI